MNVEIMVPDEYMGDVMGDINKKEVELWEWNKLVMNKSYC